MKCPFSGKCCLLPKEIFVTEVTQNDGVQHMHLCKLCGEDYVKQLPNSSTSTSKVEEIISEDNNITINHRPIDPISEPVLGPKKELTPLPKSVAILRQIVQVENKLKDAVAREDYESAAQLRDILEALQTNTNDTEDE